MSTTTDFDETEDMSGDASHCHVGAELQAVRLARDEDLDTISETLKIRASHLQALEEGWWDELPAGAYVVGFLKSYARYLGMDEDDVACRYRAASNPDSASSRLLFPEPIDDSRAPKGPLVMLSAFLALVGYGLWYVTAGAQFVAIEDTDVVPPRLASLAEGGASVAAVEEPADRATTLAANRDGADTPDAGRAESAAAETAAPAPERQQLAAVSVESPSRIAMVVPPERDLRQETELAVAEDSWSDNLSQLAGNPTLIRAAHAGTDAENPNSRVVLRARSDTWIQIQNGEDAVLHEGLLKAGERYRAPDAPGVTLTTSNIEALEIRVDGDPVELLGTTGTVKEDLPLSPERLAGSVHADIGLD